MNPAKGYLSGNQMRMLTIDIFTSMDNWLRFKK